MLHVLCIIDNNVQVPVVDVPIQSTYQYQYCPYNTPVLLYIPQWTNHETQ